MVSMVRAILQPRITPLTPWWPLDKMEGRVRTKSADQGGWAVRWKEEGEVTERRGNGGMWRKKIAQRPMQHTKGLRSRALPLHQIHSIHVCISNKVNSDLLNYFTYSFIFFKLFIVFYFILLLLFFYYYYFIMKWSLVKLCPLGSF